ncbi:MAG: hypothetical protein J6P21_02235 [Clostridia bacterium]|nr:hypothetical protein [Clostridia bacterium]
MNKKIKNKIAVFVALVSLSKNSCFASEGVSNNNNDCKALVSGIAVSKSGDKISQDKKKILTKGEKAAMYAILFSVWVGPPLLIFGVPTYLILNSIANKKIQEFEKKNGNSGSLKRELEILQEGANADRSTERLVKRVDELLNEIKLGDEHELKNSGYSLVDKFFQYNDWKLKKYSSRSPILHDFCCYDEHEKLSPDKSIKCLNKDEQAKWHFDLIKNEWKKNRENYQIKYNYYCYSTIEMIKKNDGFEILVSFSYNRRTKIPSSISFWITNNTDNKKICQYKHFCNWSWYR